MNLSWRLAVFKTIVWSLSTVHIFGATPKASRQVVAAAAIKKSNNKRRGEESDQGRRRRKKMERGLVWLCTHALGEKRLRFLCRFVLTQDEDFFSFIQHQPSLFNRRSCPYTVLYSSVLESRKFPVRPIGSFVFVQEKNEPISWTVTNIFHRRQ